MEETEITFREELSGLIEERAQPQRLQELINQITENLEAVNNYYLIKINNPT
jgi:hypothetical protein